MWLLAVLGGANLIVPGPWIPIGPGRCLTSFFFSYSMLGMGDLSQFKKGGMLS